MRCKLYNDFYKTELTNFQVQSLPLLYIFDHLGLDAPYILSLDGDEERGGK